MGGLYRCLMVGFGVVLLIVATGLLFLVEFGYRRYAEPTTPVYFYQHKSIKLSAYYSRPNASNKLSTNLTAWSSRSNENYLDDTSRVNPVSPSTSTLGISKYDDINSVSTTSPINVTQPQWRNHSMSQPSQKVSSSVDSGAKNESWPPTTNNNSLITTTPGPPITPQVLLQWTTPPAAAASPAVKSGHNNDSSVIHPDKLLSTAVRFTLPCPGVYRPVHEVIQADWMPYLLKFLRAINNSKPVTIVLANKAYEEVLFNWLISATVIVGPPIENIIVIALDGSLYQELQQREIPSIYVPYFSMLNKNHKFRRYFECVMMIRLGFMRLINHLGFDMAMYDIDAIILKNPQPLYDKHDTDIVGSRGALPKQLMRKWHVTFCIGAVFIRSNPRTGRDNRWISYSCKLASPGLGINIISMNMKCPPNVIAVVLANYRVP